MDVDALKKLQEEYAKSAQILGDLEYRIFCANEDVSLWKAQVEEMKQKMKEINKKGAELNKPEEPVRVVEPEVVQ